MASQGTTKATRQELARNLADRRDSVPEVGMMIQLVETMLDETKSSMVTAATDQLVGLQGRAKAYADILSLMKRLPQF